MSAFKIILLFIFLNSFCFSQTKTCEKIYDTPDTLAQYKAGRKEDAAAGFEPAQVIASKMIVLLETMEAKMRTGA